MDQLWHLVRAATAAATAAATTATTTGRHASSAASASDQAVAAVVAARCISLQRGGVAAALVNVRYTWHRIPCFMGPSLRIPVGFWVQEDSGFRRIPEQINLALE
jgi:hypothetical protein